MRLPNTLQRTLLLLLLLLASNTALAQGRTLACTTDFANRLSCIVEQTVWNLGPFELSIGVDTLAAINPHVAPFVAASWHATNWSATIEAATPPFAFVGRPNPIRFSFTLRF
jgi:hypothetical protein